MHDELAAEGCEAVVKTSGNTGLNFLVRWQQEGGCDDAREGASDYLCVSRLCLFKNF
jgi:hypothetical protein